MSTTFYLVLFIAFGLVFANTNIICSQDSDCNHYTTRDKFFCNRQTGSCVERPLFGLMKQLTDNTQACTNALNVGGYCGALATANCQIPVANETFIICAPGYSFDRGSRTCQVKPPQPQPVYSKLNQRCSPSNPTPEVCQDNLQCVARVCRKKLLHGENCSQSKIPCVGGSICEFDKCIRPASVALYEKCQKSEACQSGRCQDGICVKSAEVTCYSNTECPSGFYCEKYDEIHGYCINSHQNVAIADYKDCYYGCASNFDNNPAQVCMADNTCAREYVKSLCNQYCPLRADQRYEPSLGPYTLNCLSHTMTKMSEKQCEIRKVFECGSTRLTGISIFLMIFSLFFLL